MQNIEIKKYADYFSDARKLHDEILKNFEDIENKEIRNDAAIKKIEKDIKKLESLADKVDIVKISNEIKNEELVNRIKVTLESFYETIDHISKRLSADVYIEDLKISIPKYLKGTVGGPEDYKKWAKHPEELLNKFIATLLHPENIDLYKGQIKRMAVGTMSQKEFNKIFNVLKHKMIPLPNFQKFQSFKDYKQMPSSKSIQYKP